LDIFWIAFYYLTSSTGFNVGQIGITKQQGRLKKLMRKKLGIALGLLMVFSIMSASPVFAAKKYFLSFGTGGSSGTFYYLGAGFANIVSKYNKDIEITAQPTNASIENAKLVANGEADLGFVSAGCLQWLKETEDLDISNVAIMGVGHRSDIHWFTLKKTGIKSIADFKGKKIGVGPHGSGAPVNFAIPVLEAGWGYKADEDYQAVWYSFGEIINGLKDGSIDAGIITAGYPVSSIMDLASTHDLVLLETPQDILEKIIEKLPYIDPIVIPAGTYKGQNEDVLSYTEFNRILVKKDLPEDVMYRIVKTIFENEEEKNAVHPQAELWNLDNILHGADTDGVPVHPGAMKYYIEKGIVK
jgi:hypothetical protein